MRKLLEDSTDIPAPIKVSKDINKRKKRAIEDTIAAVYILETFMNKKAWEILWNKISRAFYSRNSENDFLNKKMGKISQD